MKKLHLTTPARLAMRSVKDPITGEITLTPSYDENGVQDINVAGTLVSINPEPIEYIRKSDGAMRTAYKGKSMIGDPSGEEHVVSVLINGEAIDDVVVGQTYWLTERENDNPAYPPNYSQGSLAVATLALDTASTRRAMLMAQLAKAETANTETA